MTKRKAPRFGDCVICGEHYQAHNGAQKTCSPACRDENYRRTKHPPTPAAKAWRENHKAELRDYLNKWKREHYITRPSTKRPCQVCGNDFLATGSANICSVECNAAVDRARSKEYYHANADLMRAKKRRQTIRRVKARLLTKINKLEDDQQ